MHSPPDASFAALIPCSPVQAPTTLELLCRALLQQAVYDQRAQGFSVPSRNSYEEATKEEILDWLARQLIPVPSTPTPLSDLLLLMCRYVVLHQADLMAIGQLA